MCGRYQAWVDDDELVRIVEREKKGNSARYLQQNEVFPGNIVPTIYGSYANVRAHLSSWGYKEHTGDTSKKIIINARAETAQSKPMFKDAFANNAPLARRILILTSGYYEWQKDEITGTKHRFLLRPGRKGEGLLLCGIEFTAQNGSNSHIILTTSSTGTAADIHDRMPLICPREEMRMWLYDTSFAIRKLKENITHELIISRAD